MRMNYDEIDGYGGGSEGMMKFETNTTNTWLINVADSGGRT